jgi:hypothetical protein
VLEPRLDDLADEARPVLIALLRIVVARAGLPVDPPEAQ